MEDKELTPEYLAEMERNEEAAARAEDATETYLENNHMRDNQVTQHNEENPETPGRENVLEFMVANLLALTNIAEVLAPNLLENEQWKNLKGRQEEVIQAIGLPVVERNAEELRKKIEELDD